MVLVHLFLIGSFSLSFSVPLRGDSIPRHFSVSSFYWDSGTCFFAFCLRQNIDRVCTTYTANIKRQIGRGQPTLQRSCSNNKARHFFPPITLLKVSYGQSSSWERNGGEGSGERKFKSSLLHSSSRNQTALQYSTCFHPFNLEVVPEPVHLVEHEVDVGLPDGLVGDDAAEEVGVHAERLVGDHDGAGGHHAALELGGDVAQLQLPVAGAVLRAHARAQALRDVPVRVGGGTKSGRSF